MQIYGKLSGASWELVTARRFQGWRPPSLMRKSRSFYHSMFFLWTWGICLRAATRELRTWTVVFLVGADALREWYRNSRVLMPASNQRDVTKDLWFFFFFRYRIFAQEDNLVKVTVVELFLPSRQKACSQSEFDVFNENEERHQFLQTEIVTLCR